jgi:hypothetical protein
MADTVPMFKKDAEFPQGPVKVFQVCDNRRGSEGGGAKVMASLRNLAISLLRLTGAHCIATALRACSRLGLQILRLIGLPGL